MRKFGLQAHVKMESASDGGIPEGGLQMLHIHVLAAALLGTGHMAEPGADQHEGRISRLRRSITLLVRMRVQCL